MQVDNKPKLNDRQKIDKLNDDSDFEGQIIRDKYHELHRILFQDAPRIKECLLNIGNIAQKIIDFPGQNTIQNMQNMKSFAQDIKKELKYYVDPIDIQSIQGILEYKMSETNIVNTVSDIIDKIDTNLETRVNTVSDIIDKIDTNLETRVNIEDMQYIQTVVTKIIESFEIQKGMIENDAMEFVRKVTENKDLENISDISDIIKKSMEIIKDIFNNTTTPFFKNHLNDLKLVRYISRLLKRRFHDIKDAIKKDATNVFTQMSLTKSDEIVKNLLEFTHKDTSGNEYIVEKVDEVTRVVIKKLNDAVKNTESDKDDVVINITDLAKDVTLNILKIFSDKKQKDEMQTDIYKHGIIKLLTNIFEKIDPRILKEITKSDKTKFATAIANHIIYMGDKIRKNPYNDSRINILKTHFIDTCVEDFKYKLENNGVSLKHVNKFASRFNDALDIVLDEFNKERIMSLYSPNTMTVTAELKSGTTELNIYEYIVVPIVEITLDMYNDIKEKYNSKKTIDDQVEIAVINDAEKVILNKISELLKIVEFREDNIDDIIINQIITPVADAVILDNINKYINRVIKSNANKIIKIIQEIVSETNLNNYLQYISYKCQKEYATMCVISESLIDIFNKYNIVSNINPMQLNFIKYEVIYILRNELRIFIAHYNVILIFEQLTEEDTDIYDILLTLFMIFTDVFNRDYYAFLIEETDSKILDQKFTCSQFKFLTIYYILKYARSKLLEDNKEIVYALSFDIHNLEFIYDMDSLISRIDSGMYSKVYNTLYAYYHFQNSLAKLTNFVNKLINNDKIVIRAIMYMLYRMKHSSPISTIAVHNNLYRTLNKISSMCGVANDDVNIYYIFTNMQDFNSSLKLFATYTCYYIIFMDIYKIFADDTRVTFLNRITNIHLVNMHASLNEYETDITEITNRLLGYRLLKMIDVDLLSKLLNDVNDIIQRFEQNENITRSINEILAFIKGMITSRTDSDVEIEIEDTSGIENDIKNNVNGIQNAISCLCTLPIYKFIQKVIGISSPVKHIIELFNVIYESVLTSDSAIYEIINNFIHKLNYFDIGQELYIDVLPYNPELALKHASHITNSTEYHLLTIYFNNIQLIIDNLTTNSTEVDEYISNISTSFYNMVQYIESSTEFNADRDYNVLRTIIGKSDETITQDEYTESYLVEMRETFCVHLFDKRYSDELHNNMNGGNIVYDTAYFIKNELPDIRHNDNLYGGMYKPAHEMMQLDMNFDKCKSRIQTKVISGVTPTLEKACYINALESVFRIVKETEYFNDTIALFNKSYLTIDKYIKHAIAIGFKLEFTDIEKLPLLYKNMPGYIQTAIRCALCKKDEGTLINILPISKYNPSKVIFYNDFNYKPYVDIMSLIYNKLNVDSMHEIYTILFNGDITESCYRNFNVCIAVPFFAALVYYATMVHYSKLPISDLKVILNLDASSNKVSFDSIRDFLLPVRQDIIKLVNESVYEKVEIEFKSGRKIETLNCTRKAFTDETLSEMVKILQNLDNTDFTSKNLLDVIPIFISYFINEHGKFIVDAKRLLGVINLKNESEYHFYDKLRKRYIAARSLEQEYSNTIHADMTKINTQVLMFERKIANSVIGLIYKRLAFDLYDALTSDAKISINDKVKIYLDTLKDAIIYSRCYDIEELDRKINRLVPLIDSFKNRLPTDDTNNILVIFNTEFSEMLGDKCYDILVNKLEDIITSAIRTYYFNKYDLKSKMKNESVNLEPYPDENYDTVKTYTLNNYPKIITGFASLIQAYEGLISPYISFLIYLLSNTLGNRMLSSNPSPKIYDMDKVDQFIHSMEKERSPAFTGGLAYDGEFHDYSSVTKVKTSSYHIRDLDFPFQSLTHPKYEISVNKKLCSYDTNVLTDELLDKLLDILLQIDFIKTSDDKEEYYPDDCLENIINILGKYDICITSISQEQAGSLEKLKTFMFNIVLPSMNLCVHNKQIVPANVKHKVIDRRTFEQVVVCIDRNKAAAVTESNFKVELLRKLIMRVYAIGRVLSYKMVPESVIINSPYKHLNATVCRNVQLDYVRKHYPQFSRLLIFIVDDDDILDPLTSYYVLTEAISLNYTTNVIISNQNTSKLNLYVNGNFVSRYAVWAILWSPFIYNVSIRCMPMNKEDQALHATIVAYNVNAITADICEVAKSGHVKVMYKYNSPIIRQTTDSRYSKHAEFGNPYAIKYIKAVIENDQGFDKVIVPVSTHTSAEARMYTYTTGKFVLNDSSKPVRNQNLYGLPLLITDGRKIVDNEIVRPLDWYDEFENGKYTSSFNAKHTPRHKNRENLDGDVSIVFYFASQRCLLYDGVDYQVVDKRGEFVACQDGKLTSIEKLRKLIAGDIDDYYGHKIENDFTRSLMKCNRDDLHKYVEILINEMLNPDFYMWSTNMKRFYEYVANWLNFINNARHISEDNVNIFVPDKVRGGNAKILNIVIKILLIIAIVLIVVAIISIIVKYLQKQPKIKQIIYRHNPIKHKY